MAGKPISLLIWSDSVKTGQNVSAIGTILDELYPEQPIPLDQPSLIEQTHQKKWLTLR
jgi:hypothetical protein